MDEKKTEEVKKKMVRLRKPGRCPYLFIRRTAFQAGDTWLTVEDRINLFLPWHSKRDLKVFGKNVVYSSVPLFSKRHRLLCYKYCADELIKRESDFYHYALVLGCGGGTLPRWLLEEYPSLSVDVVEYSSEILEVCRKYFLHKWESSGRLKYYYMDAQDYVQTEHSYQFIFCDLFAGTDLVPFVYEKSFVENLHMMLCVEGVLVINCGWNDPDKVKKTYQEVFGEVQVVNRKPNQTQVLVAIRR